MAMDSFQQLPSVTPMCQQNSFSYYNSDSKVDISQHRFTQHAGDVSIPVYSSHNSQTVSPAHRIYSQPNVSNSSSPYSQMFHSGFATTRPQGDHISQSAFSKTNLMGHNIPSNIMVESKISESEMYYYPTTPPLSASASVIGSPPEFNGISTPINPAYFGVNQVKDDTLSESVNHSEWVRRGSPPDTPIFIQPSSLISNGGANEGITGQCSLLSPSPSPYPNSVSSEPDLDFCDPRNLTVLPNAHTNVIPIKPSLNPLQGSLPILLHNDEEDSQFLMPRDVSMRQIVDNSLLGFQVAPQVSLSEINNNSDPVMEEEFVNDIVNFSVPEFPHYYASKRQRTDSGSDLNSNHSEPFISADEFEESECVDQLVTAYPLSPPLSGSEPYFTYTGDVLKKERCVRKSKKPSTMSSGIASMSSCSKADGTESIPDNGSEGSQTTAPSHSGVHEMEQSNDMNSGATHVPVTRRGRKQSLTEDPSKIFVCDLCNRRFRRQEHLKRHYRSLHTQDKPFECQECGKKFSRSDNLSQHARTHGSGATVMGLLEDGELPAETDADGEHIQNLGAVLYRVAAATSGSETDNSMKEVEICDDSQSRKKRKRSD